MLTESRPDGFAIVEFMSFDRVVLTHEQEGTTPAETSFEIHGTGRYFGAGGEGRIVVSGQWSLRRFDPNRFFGVHHANGPFKGRQLTLRAPEPIFSGDGVIFNATWTDDATGAGGGMNLFTDCWPSP